MRHTTAVFLACVLGLPWAAAQQKSASDQGTPSAPSAQTGNSEPSALKTFHFTALSGVAGPNAMLTSYSGAPTSQAETKPEAAPQTAATPAPGAVPAGVALPMVQLVEPGGGPQTGPPATITLQDAIARARKNYAQYLSVITDEKLARQDRLQARDALLPSFSYSQQYLGTQGNGELASGRFVTNDGVHVYRLWGVMHQEFSAGFLSPYQRAVAAQAVAQAKAEIARRGLTVTVTNLYYGLIVAQRAYANAQQALDQAQNFFKMTQELERGGEVAHSDVIKAQLQAEQQQQAFQEAMLAMSKARLDLAVVLSPSLDLNFNLVDDMDQPPALPSFSDVLGMAGRQNQDVRMATELLRQAHSEVSIARAGFFPTLSLDAVYGIEANAIALRAVDASFPQLGPVPTPGYFITASVNVPVWNWGATLSKLRQAEYRQQQAKVELSQAQRQALSNVYSYYNEAAVARAEMQQLQHSAELAGESLRLTILRYQAGDTPALDVVDAQKTVAAARDAFAQGQERYRLALAALQTLTGAF